MNILQKYILFIAMLLSGCGLLLSSCKKNDANGIDQYPWMSSDGKKKTDFIVQNPPSIALLRYIDQIWMHDGDKWSKNVTEKERGDLEKRLEYLRVRVFVVWGQRQNVVKLLEKITKEVSKCDLEELRRQFSMGNRGRKDIVTMTAEGFAKSLPESKKSDTDIAQYLFAKLVISARFRDKRIMIGITGLSRNKEEDEYTTFHLEPSSLSEIKDSIMPFWEGLNKNINIVSSGIFPPVSAKYLTHRALDTGKYPISFSDTPAGRFPGFWDDKNATFLSAGVGPIEWHTCEMFGTPKRVECLARMVVDHVVWK